LSHERAVKNLYIGYIHHLRAYRQNTPSRMMDRVVFAALGKLPVREITPHHI